MIRFRPLRFGFLAAALLAGCSSTPEEVRQQEGLDLPEPFDRREEINWQLAFADIEINERGEQDPVALAKWVTERRNAADKCLRDEPGRLLQAVDILSATRRRVPDSSFVRERLAQSLFVGAAMWFKNADMTAWSMDNLLSNNKMPDGTEPPSDEASRERLLDEWRTYLDNANAQVRLWARRGLQEYMAYRQMRPDDKAVLDSVWKLHFFLQNYEEAKKWLEAVLNELERNEDGTNPLYRDYKSIHGELVDYIAQLKIESSGKRAPRNLLPHLTRSRYDEER